MLEIMGWESKREKVCEERSYKRFTRWYLPLRNVVLVSG